MKLLEIAHAYSNQLQANGSSVICVRKSSAYFPLREFSLNKRTREFLQNQNLKPDDPIRRSVIIRACTQNYHLVPHYLTKTRKPVEKGKKRVVDLGSVGGLSPILNEESEAEDWEVAELLV